MAMMKLSLPRVSRAMDQETEALRSATVALIDANGKVVNSVKQLADYVTKASRFLYMNRHRYPTQHEALKESVARESRVLVLLATSYCGTAWLEANDPARSSNDLD